MVRTCTSALFILVGIVTLPVSLVAIWADASLLQQQGFVETYAPLAQSPVVHDYLADEASTMAVNATVGSGVGEQASQFAESLGSLAKGLGLPEGVSEALTGASSSAANLVGSTASTYISELVKSPQFATVWEEALRDSHQQLEEMIFQGSSNEGTLTISLTPLISALSETLPSQLRPLVQLIPVADARVDITTIYGLDHIRPLLTIVPTVSSWLVFASLGLLAAGVIIANRRWSAAAAAGLGAATASGIIYWAFASAGDRIVGTGVVSTELWKLTAQSVSHYLLPAILVAGLTGIIALAVASTIRWRRSRIVA